jgi:gamma-glutamylcyclotransferase (GGCT)/AIG2-like uncharacterized protein YtfP
MNVFVYGTLKKGFPNHYWMERAGGKFICEAVLNGARMFSCRYFPAIILTDGSVQGEIYTVENIAPLDHLEGYPNLYKRTLVQTSNGEAWVYHMSPEEVKDLPEIPSGVWV